MNAIDAANLGKRYGRKWALRECHLGIPAGHVVALVGPNGAGKTTLLHLAVGLASPSSGTITVCDGAQPGSDAALNQVAFVAQEAPLYPDLSVNDTLNLGRKLNNVWDQRRALNRLDELDIPLSRKVRKLSGGQRSQLALTMALSRRPALLILDEPLARLDPLARHDFLSFLMSAVSEEGISVVFSSHVLPELERIADYLIVLAGGQIQLAGDVESLLEQHRILTGPAANANAVAERLPLVQSRHSERLTQLLTRWSRATDTPPPGWEAHKVNLEELVLAYLRVPNRTTHSDASLGSTARGERQ